jgi:hypothetical protein
MKKIITYLIILMLALTKVASSQIATIQTVNGSYGSMSVNVSLNHYTGSNAIGAITMNIGYDPTVASFTGISYGLITSGIYSNTVGNNIYISYANTPAVGVDGVAFTLNFNYTGGSCNLTFNQGCEIANGLGTVISTTYINGAITQPTLNTTGIIGTQNGVYGSINNLPITFSGFPTYPTDPLTSEVGAINLNISYNSSDLQFIGISGLTGATANASNGVIHIAWSSASPINLNTTNLVLNFNYLGGTSSVSFTGTNIISNGSGQQIPVTLTNGAINQPNTNFSVTIGSNSNPSSSLIVPVTFAGFTDNEAAVTMNIAYDNTVLAYTGVSGLSGLTANASGGVVHLAWSNSGGFNITSFNLLFNYLGGTSSLQFTGQNQIADVVGAIMPVTFNNGTISQSSTSVNVTLGNPTISSGSTVLEPITFSGITGSINAATMYVSFDNTKLTYTGISNAISGVVANQDATTKTIILTWSNSSTSITNGLFADLDFTFTGGSGNCDVPVSFTTYNSNASSLANSVGGTVLANWVNGSVNQSPAAPTGSAAQSFCSGASPTVANLAATGTGILWYAASSGGTALATSTILTSGNYYASQTVGSCESTARFAVAVTVNTTPSAPTGSATQSFCSGTSPTVANLTATGTSIQWYVASSGGTALSTSTALASGNYYASQTVGTCESTSRFAVAVTVNTTPAAPTGSATQSFCSGASPTVANLTATGTGIKWYSASSGGTALSTSTALSSGNYYASQTVGGCESTARFAVAVTINALPTGVISGTQTINNGSSANLTITATGTGPFSGTYSDGTNLHNFGPGSSPIIVPVSPSLTTTYTLASLSDANCTATSLSGSATVTVNYLLNGYLYYDLNVSKPLKNVPIAINLTSNSSNVTNVTTDNTGYYSTYLPNGSYTLVASTTKAWGGVNSQDLSLLSQYLNGVSSVVTPINADPARLAAVKVNNKPAINSQDLSLLSQRLNGSISTFGVTAPDWRFQSPVVVISNSNIQINFWGICAGDVNASYSNIP